MCELLARDFSVSQNPSRYINTNILLEQKREYL